MNILLASPFFSQHWDAGHFFARALARLGHRLVLWDWRHDETPPNTEYDLAIVLKGDACTPPKLEIGPHLVCYWPDQLGREPEAEAALDQYDLVFTMVRPTPEGMIWLPGAWDEKIHLPRLQPNTYLFDTLFIGTRTDYKAATLEALGVKDIYGNGWDPKLAHRPAYLHEYAAALSAAKIAVNIHRVPDVGVTRRLFEYIACTFTLSDRAPGVEEVLGGRLFDAVTFETPEEGQELIQYYLALPQEREHLWRLEREAVREYTYTHLARKILQEVDSL